LQNFNKKNKENELKNMASPNDDKYKQSAKFEIDMEGQFDAPKTRNSLIMDIENSATSIRKKSNHFSLH
jgi:hypothetical protein